MVSRKSLFIAELGEGWEKNREAITEGVTFYLKYLGSTLLDELPTGQSYGEGQSSKAVQRIVDMVSLYTVVNILKFQTLFIFCSQIKYWI